MSHARAGRAFGPKSASTSDRSGRPAPWIGGALLLSVVFGVAPAAAQDRPFPLEGLVITASPTPRPLGSVATSVSILEGTELRERGVRSVSEALRQVPGVAVVQNGPDGATTSLFLRGGESNHVLVLVDGVQVNQPGGSYDLAGLSVENVERIEVIRGGASAVYGSDAVAGVVHVVTRTGAGDPAVGVLLRTGSYGALDWSADVRGGGDRAAYSMALTRQSGDGILAFNNRHENTVLSGRVRLALDDATRAALSVRIGDRAYHFPTDGSGQVVDRNAFTFADETVVGVDVSRAVSANVDLEARIAHYELDGGTDDQPDGPADTLGFFGFTSLDHVRRSSAELRAHLRAFGAVTTMGVEVEDQAQRSFTESASQFGTFPGRSAFDRDNRAAFVHVSADREEWGVSAGARLEDNERYGTYGTWQVGGSVRPVPTLRLRATASRALKEPTFFETFATGFARGNPNLDPERSVAWEVGGDVEVVPGVSVRATWFDQSFRDLIQYTGSPARPDDPNFFNVAAADARGVEVEGEFHVGGTRLHGAWTHLATEVVDPGLDEGPGAEFVAGEALLRRPRTTLSFAASRHAGPLALSVALRRTGSRYDRDFSTWPATRVTLEPHTLANATVGAELGQRVRLTLRGENLLDERYQEALGFPAPGRRFFVEVRTRLGGSG